MGLCNLATLWRRFEAGGTIITEKSDRRNKVSSAVCCIQLMRSARREHLQDVYQASDITHLLQQDGKKEEKSGIQQLQREAVEL